MIVIKLKKVKEFRDVQGHFSVPCTKHVKTIKFLVLIL